MVVGIVLKKNQMDTIGLASIITGVSFKSIYIIAKVRSGEYNPGKELVFLITGLFLFIIGLYFRDIEQPIIKPIYLIVLGITLKIIFIIRFILIVKSGKKMG